MAKQYAIRTFEIMNLDVFFTPAMVADSGSFSPSAQKPAQVVQDWHDLGLPIAIAAPRPATIDEIALAHDRAWALDVLGSRSPNGFGNTSRVVAASLPFTSGAMLAAARHAIAHRTIACAPVSGFHHAGPKSPSGFCTFNGLAVTAFALRSEGLVRRVGILDCDMHDGNGTDAIIAARGATWIDHFNTGARYFDRSHAAEFLARLPAIAQAMSDCDVILYQAGADPHVDDPLGGWLTTDELARRDRIVFQTFAALGIPVAWNLAGGYQRERDGSIPKVLAIHANTAREAIAVIHARRLTPRATSQKVAG